MSSRNIIITGIFLVQFLDVSQAQVGVQSAGNTIQSTKGSVSYTVGQVAQQFMDSNEGSVSEGLHHPFEIFIVSGFDVDFITIQIKPNPVSDLLFLTIQDFPLDNLQYSLLDANGKCITQQKITEPETSISMGALPSACFILTISQGNTSVKSYKIIKY